MPKLPLSARGKLLLLAGGGGLYLLLWTCGALRPRDSRSAAPRAETSAPTNASADPPPKDELTVGFVEQVRPLIAQYCFSCHSHQVHKGDLDLERFASPAEV